MANALKSLSRVTKHGFRKANSDQQSSIEYIRMTFYFVKKIRIFRYFFVFKSLVFSLLSTSPSINKLKEVRDDCKRNPSKTRTRKSPKR